MLRSSVNIMIRPIRMGLPITKLSRTWSVGAVRSTPIHMHAVKYFYTGNTVKSQSSSGKSSNNESNRANKRSTDESHSSCSETKSSESGEKSGSKKPGLKDLMKKYGWTAVAVYLGLSAIDLPVAFVIVHSLGKDKVQEAEKKVKEWLGMSTKPEDLSTKVEEDNSEQTSQSSDSSQWGALLTEFALAYAIHKSVFLLFRLPAAAAITPWAARRLESWGFSLNRKTPKFGTPPTKKQKIGGFFF